MQSSFNGVFKIFHYVDETINIKNAFDCVERPVNNRRSELKLYMCWQKPKFGELTCYRSRSLLIMIKPILYHNFEEKEVLERKLMAIIPQDKRLSASEALMNIFYKSKKKKSTSKSKSK